LKMQMVVARSALKGRDNGRGIRDDSCIAFGLLPIDGESGN
jgi:hypothetical protein